MEISWIEALALLGVGAVSGALNVLAGGGSFLTLPLLIFLGLPPGVDVAASGTFICRRTGRPGNKLPGPPFRGPIGQWIHENISAETWRDWIGQGTKVINELRLDFSNDKHQEVYDQYMLEWLQISREEIDEYAKQVEST